MEALKVTPEIIEEQGQETLRQFIGAVTMVELIIGGRVSISTREQRYNISPGDYLIKDEDKKPKERIQIISEFEIDAIYEIIE